MCFRVHLETSFCLVFTSAALTGGSIVTLEFSVCHSLGRPGIALMAAAVAASCAVLAMYGCFDFVGLFGSSLQKEARRC